jgi:hypothetical protein
VPVAAGKALVTAPALGAISLRPASASPAASLARAEQDGEGFLLAAEGLRSAWTDRAG